MKSSVFFLSLLCITSILAGCSTPQAPNTPQTETTFSGTQIRKDYISGSTMISYTTKDETVSLGYFGNVELTLSGETIPYESYVYITNKPGEDQVVHGAIAIFDARYTDAMIQYFSGLVARPFDVSGDDGAGKNWIIFQDPNETVTIKQVVLSYGDGSFEE